MKKAQEKKYERSFYRQYFYMAIEEYLNAFRIEKKRDILIAKKAEDDVRAFVKIASLSGTMENSFIKIIILCASAAEAFINHYAIERLSSSYFDDYLDRLNTVSKWIVIPKLVTGSQISSASKAIKGLKALIKIRNKLIHSKTRFLTFEQMIEENLFTGADVQDALRTIGKLASELSIIDSSVETDWIMDELNDLASKTSEN